MKIYTKTGDKGETSLVGGTRVSKTHVRIEAYGTVDELNAWIGRLRDHGETSLWKDRIITVQDRLFTIGSNLALETPGKFNIPLLHEDDITDLESWMDEMDVGLPAMRNFVLPGGHPVVSDCHITRTVCRRAERQVLRMAEEIDVDALIVTYLNRLSDLLFVLARKLTFDGGFEEMPWQPKKA
ncbi:MAG: cob(I)yrinic acid a,c-diamide adenosyltransferase [Bacteroidetes bacterium]|jgi:cob(I)alamin adenosyltransferase|nr:cob(I)yrinic acid a,c-diamide adenosyltransferase [Bacteroidota bacterium]MDA0973951.1 cob(I)yrinic acid a,c-diamide adenosyltransferase [Bacteroidota bacterium]